MTEESKHTISALVAPVLPDEAWRATVDSIVPHADEVVVLRVSPPEPPEYPDEKVRFIDLWPETHPHLFLHDVPETWAGTELQERCTGEHILSDYAAAKQLAWDSLEGDFKLWLEPYDVIERGERLAALAAEAARERVTMIMMNYDFAKDPSGNVTVRLLRERMVRRTCTSRWAPFLRETLPYTQDDVVWETHVVNVVRLPGAKDRMHMFLKLMRRWALLRAQAENSKIVRRRVQEGTLLRRPGAEILKDEEDRPPLTMAELVELRMLFYLGSDEMQRYPEDAIEHFKQYCARSTWPQERALAHIRSGIIHETRERFDQAKDEYVAALMDHPESTEAHFGLARIGFFKRDWETTIDATKAGYDAAEMAASRHQSPMHTPVESDVRPLVFLSVALIELERYSQAIETCQRGLKLVPDEPRLANNLAYAISKIGPREMRPS